MSARSHVDVNERRLRPIYDCLDNGNNKKALQEADKVLKKQKDFSCAKVLKGLALLRLGRHDESTALLQEVHALSPSDEATLQAMGIAYRELHKLELVADMYENAHKMKPDNEEVLSALFMSYVRLGNYKKQQQTAMILHRLRPNKNPYYFWAVMSIVMQAHVDKKLAKTMFLPLAERMASKYVAEGKIEAEAEVQMYLIILEQLGKYEEALNLVQGELGKKLTSEPGYQVYKAAELLGKLERLPQTNAAYRNLLIKNLDNWSFYKEYFRTLFALIDSGWTPDQDNSVNDPVDHTVEEAVTFLQEQVDRAAALDHKPRGPYLAQLELIAQLKKRNHSEHIDKMSPAEELIRQYYRTFGDKQCCFTDIALFIDLIESHQVEKIITEFSQELGLNKDTGSLQCADNVKSMQRHLCLLQLARHAGLHDNMSEVEKNSLITDLIRHYESGLKFGKDLLTTDLQFSDNYILLAGHLLADIWQNTGDQKNLWRAIVLLEKGLKWSPSSFQIRLFLIQLYSILGAFQPCLVLYEGMEIKHIQNDALGYVICNHVGRLGHFTSASSIYGSMLRFFTINHKDTTEYLISSYKFGSFTKIHEFVEFRERLQNSLQYACATAEQLLLDLTLETSGHQGAEQMLGYMEFDPKRDRTVWEDLRDNRDLRVMLTWEPRSRVLSDELIERSFKEEVAWLKVRSLTLRVLASALMLTQQNQSNNKVGNIGNGDAENLSMAVTLENLRDELHTHMVNVCPQFKDTANYPLAGPSSSRLPSYLQRPYATVLLDMLCIVLYTHRLNEEGLDKADKEQEAKFKSTVETLSGLAEAIQSRLIQTEDGKTIFRPDVMDDVVHTVELLAHVTILLGCCHKMLKPMKNSITKKTKKKKENPPVLPETFACYESLVCGTESVARQVKSTLVEVNSEILASLLASLKIATTEEEEPEKIEQELVSQLEASYLQSIKETSDLVQTKQTYLSTLHL